MATNQTAEMDPCCGICRTPYGELNGEGVIEQPSLLPCGHILGHDCSQRWLTTLNASRSCPICRFPLRYIKCGHVIRPRPLTEAPAKVSSARDLPSFCPDACDEFIRSLFDEERIWDRAQQDAIWLLRAMEHSEADADKIAEQIEFTTRKMDESRASFRERFRAYLDTDFASRW